MTEILLAEDDPQIREWVTFALEKERHRVRAVTDGVAALTAYNERRPDLIILDIMMPKRSGYDVCREIRKMDRAIPILLLTAKSSETDKLEGFALGADDYVTKPFGVRELMARVSALLRRAGVTQATGPDPSIFPFGNHRVNVARRLLIQPDGTEVELTALEVGILSFLAAHPGEVVTRDNLLNGIWGIAYNGTTRTLDTRIAVLRKKLGADASRIETLYGTGYRYRKI